MMTKKMMMMKTEKRYNFLHKKLKFGYSLGINHIFKSPYISYTSPLNIPVYQPYLFCVIFFYIVQDKKVLEMIFVILHQIYIL